MFLSTIYISDFNPKILYCVYMLRNSINIVLYSCDIWQIFFFFFYLSCLVLKHQEIEMNVKQKFICFLCYFRHRKKTERTSKGNSRGFVEDSSFSNFLICFYFYSSGLPFLLRMMFHVLFSPFE